MSINELTEYLESFYEVAGGEATFPSHRYSTQANPSTAFRPCTPTPPPRALNISFDNIIQPSAVTIKSVLKRPAPVFARYYCPGFLCDNEPRSMDGSVDSNPELGLWLSDFVIKDDVPVVPAYPVPLHGYPVTGVQPLTGQTLDCSSTGTNGKPTLLGTQDFSEDGDLSLIRSLIPNHISGYEAQEPALGANLARSCFLGASQVHDNEEIAAIPDGRYPETLQSPEGNRFPLKEQQQHEALQHSLNASARTTQVALGEIDYESAYAYDQEALSQATNLFDIHLAHYILKKQAGLAKVKKIKGLEDAVVGNTPNDDEGAGNSGMRACENNAGDVSNACGGNDTWTGKTHPSTKNVKFGTHDAVRIYRKEERPNRVSDGKTYLVIMAE